MPEHTTASFASVDAGLPWPRIEFEPTRRMSATMSGGISPRIIREEPLVLLAPPQSMPKGLLIGMLIGLLLAIGLATAIIVVAWTQGSSNERIIVTAVASVAGFIGCIGVVGGCVGSWMFEKRRGPIAVFDRKRSLVMFPRSGSGFALADIHAIEYVHGLVAFSRHKGHIQYLRERQTFVRGRNDAGQPVHIMVHRQPNNLAKGLRQFALEINVPFEEHRLPRSQAVRIE